MEYLPGNPLALDLLGFLAQEDRDLAGVETWYRQAASFWPDNQNFRWNLAVAYALQKKLAEAEIQFRRLVEQDGSNVRYLRALAQCLQEQGRMAEAEKFQQRAKELASERGLFQPGPELPR